MNDEELNNLNDVNIGSVVNENTEISDEILCTRTKNLKRVSEDHVCRQFSFDILSYRPNPTKMPKFKVESIEDIL